jgi:hypothetical protein
MAADINLSKIWLEIAIKRHERHMAGKEPTTGTAGDISQKLMMEEMKYALRALVEGLVVTTNWYDTNITKYPDKAGSMKM